MVAFVGFRYYRRYAIQSEQIQQAQLQKEQEAAKLLKQKKTLSKKLVRLRAKWTSRMTYCQASRLLKPA